MRVITHRHLICYTQHNKVCRWSYPNQEVAQLCKMSQHMQFKCVFNFASSLLSNMFSSYDYVYHRITYFCTLLDRGCIKWVQNEDTFGLLLICSQIMPVQCDYSLNKILEIWVEKQLESDNNQFNGVTYKMCINIIITHISAKYTSERYIFYTECYFS